MPSLLTSLTVLALVAGAVALAVRSLWRDREAGKSRGCGGDCSRCKGCH